MKRLILISLILGSPAAAFAEQIACSLTTDAEALLNENIVITARMSIASGAGPLGSGPAFAPVGLHHQPDRDAPFHTTEVRCIGPSLDPYSK